MRHNDDGNRYDARVHSPVVIHTSSDFQLDVLEKLGRLEAKVDMIVGNGQPGRMRLAEERITVLEGHDIRRNLLDRIVTAAIAFAISAAIALHDHFLPK